MKRLYVTTALVTLLAAGPAFAAGQDAPVTANPPEASQQQDTAKPGSIEFIAEQKENDWMASSLIGRAVQDGEERSLGKINDVLLDQNGDAVAVLIGVGGFLGIGGKDVAVNYGALVFKKREIKQPATPGRDARETAYRRSTTPPGGGASQNPLVAQQSRQTPPAPRKDADHSDMVIVLNATPEQLETAPPFRRLGESEPERQSENQPADKGARMTPEQKTQQ